MMNDRELSPLIESLLDPSAYDHPVAPGVDRIETHISWVLLAGDFAYKIKKPVRNSFLDYSTIELRHHYCQEELRLNRRFAPELYLDVVPITSNGRQVHIGGSGKPIEYAVRMRRFPDDDLLSHRLNLGLVNVHDVRRLAMRIGQFHAEAEQADATTPWGSPKQLYSEAIDNCLALEQAQIERTRDCIHRLRRWTDDFFTKHLDHFAQRHASGHIRQCHGDLHLNNIVLWKGEFIPFDGIEFSSSFHWIDTLSDAAFTAMDFAAHGRMDYCNSFINATFEASGDYAAVEILPWYLAYRTMVRAKVAAMRLQQLDSAGTADCVGNDRVADTDTVVAAAESQAESRPRGHRQFEPDLDSLLDLALRFTETKCESPTLWITYGVSGSGKTTGSEHFVQGQGAVRIRADVERKRLGGSSAISPSRCASIGELYNDAMTQATYERLVKLAESILRTGQSVIVDATCLLQWQRKLFRALAERMQIQFHIVPFHADHALLRERIVARRAAGQDASDADLQVLQSQLAHQEHLTPDELTFALSTLS